LATLNLLTIYCR